MTNDTVSGITTVENVAVNVVEFLTAITLTGTVEDVTTEVIEIVDSVEATATADNNSTVTATVFDFQAHADNYSKKRTVYVSRAA